MTFLGIIIICAVGVPRESCNQHAATDQVYVLPETFSSIAACQAAALALAPNVVTKGFYINVYCGPSAKIIKMFGGIRA